MSMSETKTDRILLLLQTLKDAPHSRMSEDDVRNILGNPSRANFYKLINSLLVERGKLRPLIIKMKMGEKIYFALNRQEWQQFAEIDNETHFILHCMKNTENNFSHIADELGIFERRNIKGLEQKFIHIERQKKEKMNCEQKNNLQKIMRSIIGNKKNLITTHKQTFDFVPLTICSYDHHLFVMGARNEFRGENLVAIKIVDIDRIVETNNCFTYPSLGRYNPDMIYRKIKSIMINDEAEILNFQKVDMEIDVSKISEEERLEILKKAEKIIEKLSRKLLSAA